MKSRTANCFDVSRPTAIRRRSLRSCAGTGPWCSASAGGLLPNVQDAEDACQATFLVLANKAAGGQWQPSVANWLYATARKVAHNARVAAERRAKREGRAAVPEADRRWTR